jgi:hypothetical protein
MKLAKTNDNASPRQQVSNHLHNHFSKRKKLEKSKLCNESRLSSFQIKNEYSNIKV